MKNTKKTPPSPESMKILNDPNYVALKRFDFSMKKLKARYPDGAPTHVAAHALGLSKESFEEEYERLVVKLRTEMGIDKL